MGKVGRRRRARVFIQVAAAGSEGESELLELLLVLSTIMRQASDGLMIAVLEPPRKGCDPVLIHEGAGVVVPNDGKALFPVDAGK